MRPFLKQNSILFVMSSGCRRPRAGEQARLRIPLQGEYQGDRGPLNIPGVCAISIRGKTRLQAIPRTDHVLTGRGIRISLVAFRAHWAVALRPVGGFGWLVEPAVNW